MVSVAQRGRAHDGIEVPNRAPRPIQPIERLRERFGDRIPGRGARICRDGLDGSASVANQQIDCGRDMFGAEGIESAQAGKIEQRIAKVVSVHSRVLGVFERSPGSKARCVPEDKR